MSDSDWVVGDFIESSGQWLKNGVEVTAGSATVTYWSADGSGGRLYLQSNGTTMAATPHSFALAYDAVKKWNRALTVPTSMNGKVIQEVIQHSDVSLEVYGFGHRVTDGGFPGAFDGAHVVGS